MIKLLLVTKAAFIVKILDEEQVKVTFHSPSLSFLTYRLNIPDSLFDPITYISSYLDSTLNKNLLCYYPLIRMIPSFKRFSGKTNVIAKTRFESTLSSIV